MVRACQNCGAMIDDSRVYCPVCGAELNESAAEEPLSADLANPYEVGASRSAKSFHEYWDEVPETPSYWRAVGICFKKSFDGRGRATPSEFWQWTTFYWAYQILILAAILLGANAPLDAFLAVSGSYFAIFLLWPAAFEALSIFIIIGASIVFPDSSLRDAEFLAILLLLSAANAFFWIANFSAEKRRLHDSERSSFLAVLGVVLPLVHLVSLIAAMFKSDPLDNRYGPPPKKDEKTSSESNEA